MTTTPTVSPVVPAPPLYTSAEEYTTSPIICAPAPHMQASRTLRERCGVTMNLRISTSGFSPIKGPWSPKGHTQPHRSNLPRRRKVTKFNIVQSPVMEKEEVVIEAKIDAATALDIDDDTSKYPVSPPPSQYEGHTQEIIPGIHVAFSDEPLDGQEEGSSTKPYTHVVNIVNPPDNSKSDVGSCERSLVESVQRLLITLPSSARVQGSQRPGLGLTENHLRTIRDFIGEALPHSLASSEEESSVRVLVTSPYGRPTDVMCAVGCYLAFISGKEVETILRYIDEEEEVLSIWKAEVSGNEADETEKIARSWSWLTPIVLPKEPST